MLNEQVSGHQIGDARWVVRDGIEDEDGGPCIEWWVQRQILVHIGEYEPGFPVPDLDWHDDDALDAFRGPFDSPTAAASQAAALRKEAT